MLELPISRLSRAYTTWPTGLEWALTALALLLFALCALALLRASGDLALRPLNAGWPKLLGIVAVAPLSPALLEETLYRALLNPHPLEAAAPETRLFWGGVSLALYVLAHPIAAWRWRWARAYFWRPAFLAVVVLLGLACTALYLRTGSVWPPVALHAATTVLWKLYFGGPPEPLAGLREVRES
jgi:uncharacterized protein